MKYIKTFDNFLNERIEAFDGTLDEQLKVIDKFIEAAKKMKPSDPVIWRGMSTKDRTRRFSNNSTFVEMFADRDVFRGGNPGARKMMNILKIKDPVFVHFNPTSSEFFGSVYAVIPNSSFKIYQSKMVDDVKAFNREEIYFAEDDSSRRSAQMHVWKFKDKKVAEDTYRELKKLGYKDTSLSKKALEESVYKMIDSEKEIERLCHYDEKNLEVYCLPGLSPNEEHQVQRVSKMGSPTETIRFKNVGKREDVRAKMGANSYKTLNGTKPVLPGREGILSTNSYYAVMMKTILKDGGRFMKYKSLSDIKTYKDLIDALYTYRGFQKWMLNKRS